MSIRFNRAGLRAIDPVYAAIILSGSALRLYGLGTQGQWVDEMLSTLNASFSLHYIFDLCWTVEVHPPGYYLFKHAQLYFGASDTWLRLPSALCGIIALHYAYRLGRVLLDSRHFGHLFMAMCAFNPLHIWVSRQSRPYGITLLASIIIVTYLARAVRRGRQTSVVVPSMCNFVFAAFHFSGILFFASQVLSIFLLKICQRSRASWNIMVKYSVFGSFCLIPSVVFFVHARFIRIDPWISHRASAGKSAEHFFAVFKEYLFLGYQGVESIWRVTAALIVLSLIMLAMNKNRVGWLLASVMLTTIAALILGGYSAHFTAVHISFLLPVSICLASYAIFSLFHAFRAEKLAVWSSVLFLSAFLLVDSQYFYSPNKSPADLYGPNDRYKVVAEFMNSFTSPGIVAAYDDQMDANAVSWYTDLPCRRQGCSQRNLSENDLEVLLFYFTKSSDWKHTDCCAVNKTSGLEIPALFQTKVGSLDLYLQKYSRSRSIRLDNAENTVKITAQPEDVLARCLSFQGLNLALENDGQRVDGGSFFLSPSYANVPGECTFRFVCDGKSQHPVLDLVIHSSVFREGNEVIVQYRTGQGMWTTLERRNQARSETIQGRIALPQGGSSVDVKISMVFQGYSAFTMYGPNTQVRFKSMTATLSEDGRAGISGK